jgi:hypothetical protein
VFVEKWRQLKNWQKSCILSVLLPIFAVTLLMVASYFFVWLEQAKLPFLIQMLIELIAAILRVPLGPGAGYFVLVLFLVVLLPSLIFTIKSFQNKENLAWLTQVGFLFMLIELVWLISIAVKVTT